MSVSVHGSTVTESWRHLWLKQALKSSRLFVFECGLKNSQHDRVSFVSSWEHSTEPGPSLFIQQTSYYTGFSHATQQMLHRAVGPVAL